MNQVLLEQLASRRQDELAARAARRHRVEHPGPAAHDRRRQRRGTRVGRPRALTARLVALVTRP